jgi:hypothetical protein
MSEHLDRVSPPLETCLHCGQLEILIQVAPGTLTIRVRAPVSAPSVVIEACFFRIATALARVESVTPAGLGYLAWELTDERLFDYFELTRPFSAGEYPRVFERELTAIIQEARRALH